MADLGASSHYDLDYSLPALIEAGRAVVPLVKLQLRSSDPIVRDRTIHVLKWIGDTRVVPDLIGLLADTGIGDTKSRICDLAADALQHLGTPQAVRAVEQWRRS
jgi:HEAT repeat protein